MKQAPLWGTLEKSVFISRPPRRCQYVQWIEEWLLEQAEHAVQQWEAQGVTPIGAWDGCVLEKNESQVSEGLCPVHWSVAESRGGQAAGTRATGGVECAQQKVDAATGGLGASVASQPTRGICAPTSQ